LKSHTINIAVALREDIDKFIDYFYGKYQVFDDTPDNDDLFDRLELEVVEDDDEQESDDSFGSHSEGMVVQMANKIIEDAVNSNASDIHIESLAGNKGVQIRFRIDGQCQFYRNIPFSFKRSLVSRLKILAKLDISEKRLPQDGKIKFRTRNRNSIELRIATLPTVGANEDVVLRVLANTAALPLGKAGLLKANYDTLSKIIDMPYGLVAVVGPTGSGKTTTLHACLNYLNKPEKKYGPLKIR